MFKPNRLFRTVPIASYSVIFTLLILLAPLFAEHPRLLVNQKKLEKIKNAITIKSSTHYEAYHALKSKVDTGDWHVFDGNPDDGNWNYARSYFARAAAFLYLLTDSTRYADMAYNVLVKVHSNPDPDGRLPESSYGLARATVGRGFAFAYDWCYHGWSEEQRNYVKGKIMLALDEWLNFRHANLEDPTYGSNWVAVCRGGELIMMLAVDEEKNRERRFANLKYWLKSHIQNGYGDIGFTQEGIGYAGYAGIFLHPAVFACQSIGDTYFDDVYYDIAWWKMAAYSGSSIVTEGYYRQFLQNGVAHRGIGDEGWVSLLLNSVKNDSLAYYQYFYDHHMGINSPGTPEQKYDQNRAAQVWSLLYYPDSLTAQNPNNKLPKLVADEEKGAFFFRNRWLDENDILCSIMGDFHHHGHAWDQSETFQINLMAFGTRFIGGPGKEYKNPDVFSTLLIDGLVTELNNSEKIKNGLTGDPGYYRVTGSGGYVMVKGGEKYDDLGLDDVERHLTVHFEDNHAILATFDNIKDVANPVYEYTYTWQLNLGDETGDDAIVSKIDESAERPAFELYGNNNGYVKGWVLYPSDATIKVGDPVQITTKGQEEKLIVVMVVDSGDVKNAQIYGTGLDTRLKWNNRIVQYNRKINEIDISEIDTKVGKTGSVIKSFQLYQNFPNPFNPNTTIPYQLEQSARVHLAVYNIAGQRVKTLVNDFKQPGQYCIQWDGTNDGRKKLSSGIYICKLSVKTKSERIEKNHKMILLK